jgi:hypothetical protein
VYFDNRIPPRGFTNTAFAAIQSPPVGHAYADGQYWDDADYWLPASATTVSVTLYYQTTTKDFVTFLRDANVTNLAGQTMYDQWLAAGRGAPIAMRTLTIPVAVTAAGDPGDVPAALVFDAVTPNPSHGEMHISWGMPRLAPVSIAVYDVQGRKVRSLVNEVRRAGRQTTTWNGHDEQGRPVSSGVYVAVCKSEDRTLIQRIVLVR